jgi:hypothetical protein
MQKPNKFTSTETFDVENNKVQLIKHVALLNLHSYWISKPIRSTEARVLYAIQFHIGATQ